MRLVSDTTWATLNIWMEARGEPFSGKIAVAEVMWTRMQRRYMSDGTVVGTILRPYQFSGWNTADPNRLIAARLDDSDPIVQECERAWQKVKMTPPENFLTRGAVLYYNPRAVSATPNWAVPEKRLVTIGAHEFFSD